MKDNYSVALAISLIVFIFAAATIFILAGETNKINNAPSIAYYTSEEFREQRGNILIMLQNGFSIKTTDKYVILYRSNIIDLPFTK